jgi:serine protease AprX
MRENVLISVLFLFLSTLYLKGQDSGYNYYYRIYFRDKGENRISDFTPAELFSQRAIERRKKEGITQLDFMDIPVYTGYLDIISSMGMKFHCKSRWMNTALFKSAGPVDMNSLLDLSFVENVKIVKNPVSKGEHRDKFEKEFNYDRNAYNNAIIMVNGEIVQSSGYQGRGKLIAVLDGGFLNFDKLPALEALRLRNSGIIATYDFVKRDSFVYDYHTHGSNVMCVLAGEIQNQLAGTAPGASFLLLRTEDTFSEFPVEEDFWASGAEYADSAGCDIITSSLGYSLYDDPSMDYKVSDMDGHTVFVTLAAEAATAKGIVVVNSAGNERDNSWNHIIAPADGENVFSVGAVDWNGILASFSSPGPSSDGRIKPDVVAQGVYIPVQTINSYQQPGALAEITNVNGTSFSCPVISGMIACLMQAVPEAKASDIVSTIRAVSDRYDSPDNDYGYGIPDMAKAVEMLQEKFVPLPSESLAIGPNPFTDLLKVTFRENPEWLFVEIFDSSGKRVYNRFYNQYISLTYTIDELRNYVQGIYFLRLSTARGKFTCKVIKAGRQ